MSNMYKMASAYVCCVVNSGKIVENCRTDVTYCFHHNGPLKTVDRMN